MRDPRRAKVLRYRTEILIPSDRYVCLQLPDRLPEGKAIVTVVFEQQPGNSDPESDNRDSDQDDIEWWDEFEEADDVLP